MAYFRGVGTPVTAGRHTNPAFAGGWGLGEAILAPYTGDTQNAAAVAAWIMRSVPSFVGGDRIPPDWMAGVIGRLQRDMVPAHVIRTALLALRARGYEFSTSGPEMRSIGFNVLVLADPIHQPRGPRQTSMGPISRGDRERSLVYGAQVLEEKFRKAQRSDDVKGMTEAAEAYQKLRGELLSEGPGGPMPGRGRMERDRNAVLAAREEMLRRAAPSLENARRLHLRPSDFRRLTRAPRPRTR